MSWRGAGRLALLMAVATVLMVLAVPPFPADAAPPATPLATPPAPTQPPPTLPPAKASVVVDADTGAVLDAVNDRTPVPVASTIKLFTALVVDRRVKPTDLVPISARAASMPYLKMSAKPGQRWSADGLLHAMLIASANDAAVALAERAGGGTTAGYQRLFRSDARALGLRDAPVLQDPAGLDDEFSVGGGNLISARDLAIVARAFLRVPALASIALLPDYRFLGGDGQEHRVRNHDRFLGTYPGAIGLKTGHTKRSGYTLVAAARRDGHTLIAVVVQSANTVQEASNLLDAGFAAVRRGGRNLGRLPEPSALPAAPQPDRPRSAPRRARPDGTTSPAEPVRVSSGSRSNEGWTSSGALQAALLIMLALGGAVFLRRREVVRRQEAARRRRARARSARVD